MKDFVPALNHSICAVAPSSSGPGRQVLILKIAGSTPAGVTTKQAQLRLGFFRGHFPREIESEELITTSSRRRLHRISNEDLPISLAERYN